MALPTYVAAGAKTEGLTTATAIPLPAGIATDDILLLVVEQANAVSTYGSVSNANGGTWTLIDFQGVGATTTFAGVKVFWSRYNGTQGNPTYDPTASANHFLARIVAFRGCETSGDPWDVLTKSSDSDANTTFTATGPTTTVADCLIVICAALADDSPTFGATWTNANLSSITNRTTDTTLQGNDGSLSVVTGGKATAGAVGDTTNTLSAAVNGVAIVLALKPPAVAGAQTVSPGLIDQSAVLFAPKINPSVSVGLIAQDATLFAPKVGPGISVPLISQLATLFAPSISENVKPGLIDQSAVLFAPKLNLTVSFPLIDRSAILFAPSFPTAGAQTVSPGLIDQSATLFAPKVNEGVSVPLISQPALLFAPTINPKIAVPLILQPATLFGPKINPKLALPLIDRSAVLFSPSMKLAVSIPLIDRTATLFNPVLAGGGAFGAPVDDPSTRLLGGTAASLLGGGAASDTAQVSEGRSSLGDQGGRAT